jgi:hypothetical protein
VPATLARPVTPAGEVVGYLDADGSDRLWVLPRRLVLARRADTQPDLRIILYSGEPADGALLQASWMADHGTVEHQGASEPLVPVAAHVRLRVVQALPAEPLLSDWQPIAWTGGGIQAPPIALERHAATLLASAARLGSLGAVLEVDAVVDLPVWRPVCAGELEIDLAELDAWVRSQWPSDPPTAGEMAGPLRRWVVDRLGDALRLSVSTDEPGVAGEVVARVLELGGLVPVAGHATDGPVDMTRWTPPPGTGIHRSDLSVPRPASLRRLLAADTAALDGVTDVVETVTVPPFSTAFTITAQSWLPADAEVVSSCAVKVRRRVGNRLEDSHLELGPAGASSIATVEGHHFFLQTPDVSWRAELVPGPVLAANGVAEVRAASGTPGGKTRHTAVTIGPGSFGLGGVVVQVDRAVAEIVADILAELVDANGSVVGHRRLRAAGDWWIPYRADSGTSPVRVRLLASAPESATDTVVLADEPLGPTRRVQLTMAHLAADAVTVEVGIGILPEGVRVVSALVSLDRGDATGAELVAVRAGEPVVQWRVARVHRFEPVHWYWAARVIVQVNGLRSTVVLARREGVGSTLGIDGPLLEAHLQAAPT